MSFRYGGVTYAQHGEDILIVDIFAQLGIDKPSYLDLGAHRPDDISNTKLLYERGSRGVNIEANPNLIKLFIDARAEDTNVCAAVVHAEQEDEGLPFYMFDDLSGLNTFSKQDADVFHQQSGIDYETKTLVGTEFLSLKTIIERYCKGKYPHFINCDIEGFDYAILSQLDQNLEMPAVVCAEVRTHDSRRFTLMMEGKGFCARARMGENIIYTRDDVERALAVLRGACEWGA